MTAGCFVTRNIEQHILFKMS